MTTPKQLKYLIDLYEAIGQEPEEDLEDLTDSEASQRITELLQIKEDIN